ncbi:MAG: PDZ domain-containing protein [Anaerolineae bacterium]|nr:PDZ domain-containing protein [Anaerolineae bacterium]
MKKRMLILVSILVVLVMSLSACSSLGITSSGINTAVGTKTPAPSQIIPTATPEIAPVGDAGSLLAAYQGTLENVYTTVNPSVVNIRVVKKVAVTDTLLDQLPDFPFFHLPNDQQPQEQYQSVLGSGFIWDQDGHIVTNNHVINQADKIEVTFSDGTVTSAELVGADPDSDLAVLKVDTDTSRLRPLRLGDSGAVKVGQLAIAIGNPFGLEGTMTTGIVSAIGRSLPSDETSSQSYIIPEVIQTDAPINPGNSGGVLVDIDGRIIGVTSAIESSVQSNAGIGFAIPSEIINNVVPVLISEGKFVHAWLGITGTNLTPDMAKAMNLDESQQGALVEEVLPNSPAEKVGLQGSNHEVTIDGQTLMVGGDVITAIDSKPVSEMYDIIDYLALSTKVGQTVTLTILRDGTAQQIDVTLQARPSADELSKMEAPTGKQGVVLGIRGVTVSAAIAKAMNLPEDQRGVLVEQVDSGSLADTAGLRAGSESLDLDGQKVTIGGDIITAVNGQSVANMQALKSLLSKLDPDQELSLSIIRDGAEIQITIQTSA